MVHSTAQYFEKRIENLEHKVAELQLQIERLSRNKLLSDRHLDMIERRSESYDTED